MKINQSSLLPSLQSTCDDQGNSGSPATFLPNNALSNRLPHSAAPNEILSAGYLIENEQEKIFAKRTKYFETERLELESISAYCKKKFTILEYFSNNIIPHEKDALESNRILFSNALTHFNQKIANIHDRYNNLISKTSLQNKRSEILLQSLNSETNNSDKKPPLKSLFNRETISNENIDEEATQLKKDKLLAIKAYTTATQDFWKHITRNHVAFVTESESINAVNFLSWSQSNISMAKINLEKIQSYIYSIATLQTQDNLKQCSMAINDGIEFIDSLQYSLRDHYEKNSTLQSLRTKNPAFPVTLNIMNRLGLAKFDLPNSVNGITKKWHLMITKRLDTAFERLEDISKKNMNERGRQYELYLKSNDDS